MRDSGVRPCLTAPLPVRAALLLALASTSTPLLAGGWIEDRPDKTAIHVVVPVFAQNVTMRGIVVPVEK